MAYQIPLEEICQRTRLMVLQGANDPRVLKAGSDEIVEAAKKNGVVTEYIVFPDEGHGFVKKENEVRGYTAVIGFLDKHFKEGRDDPVAEKRAARTESPGDGIS